MAYHAVLGVSLCFVSICILDNDGVIQFEGKAVLDVEAIVTCLKVFSLSIW
jgi:hypothetical protein